MVHMNHPGGWNGHEAGTIGHCGGESPVSSHLSNIIYKNIKGKRAIADDDNRKIEAELIAGMKQTENKIISSTQFTKHAV